MKSPLRGTSGSISSDDLFDTDSSGTYQFGGQSDSDNDCLASVASDEGSDRSRDLFSRSDSEESDGDNVTRTSGKHRKSKKSSKGGASMGRYTDIRSCRHT